MKGLVVFSVNVTKIIITTSLTRKIQLEIVNLMNSAKFLYHLKTNSGERLNLISREVERFTSTFNNISLMIISSISIIIFMGSLFFIDFLLVTIVIFLALILSFFLQTDIYFIKEIFILYLQTLALTSKSFL